jgi:hypothetical protein
MRYGETATGSRRPVNIMRQLRRLSPRIRKPYKFGETFKGVIYAEGPLIMNLLQRFQSIFYDREPKCYRIEDGVPWEQFEHLAHTYLKESV